MRGNGKNLVFAILLTGLIVVAGTILFAPELMQDQRDQQQALSKMVRYAISPAGDRLLDPIVQRVSDSQYIVAINQTAELDSIYLRSVREYIKTYGLKNRTADIAVYFIPTPTVALAPFFEWLTPQRFWLLFLNGVLLSIGFPMFFETFRCEIDSIRNKVRVSIASSFSAFAAFTFFLKRVVRNSFKFVCAVPKIALTPAYTIVRMGVASISYVQEKRELRRDREEVRMRNEELKGALSLQERTLESEVDVLRRQLSGAKIAWMDATQELQRTKSSQNAIAESLATQADIFPAPHATKQPVGGLLAGHDFIEAESDATPSTEAAEINHLSL